MKKEAFTELLDSVKEMQAMRRGTRPLGRVTTPEDLVEPDVVALRESMALSQPDFADAMGISLATLRNWEQGRRRPDGPARVLLIVFKRHPETVVESVLAARRARRHKKTA